MRRWLRSIGPVEVVILAGGLVALGLVVYADLLAATVFERTLSRDPVLPELIDRERLLLRRTNLGLSLLLAVVFAVVFAVVRRRRRELERLSRHHESLLLSADEAIFALDRQGRVTTANPAAARLTGYDLDELLGQQLHDLVHSRRADGTPYPYEDCPTAAAEQGERVGEVTGEVFWRADGSSVPVEYSSQPIMVGGEVVGVVQVVRDVSARRAVERMKGEFVSIISHELRTPLTSIHGALGLLGGGLLGPLPDKGQRMVDIALDNTERLIRLINDILDIERLESGGVELRREDCPLGPLMERAADTMGAMAAQAGVELSVTPVEALLWADPDRLTQVLINLLGNAVKFSPPGGTVRLDGVERGDVVRLTVSDQGRGIPADQLESIFSRFKQVDASDSRAKGGTGLGLTISRHIVQQHDGRIWAESGPGRGTTFHVELPVLSRTAEPPATGPAVLVCDDDPSVRAVLRAVLSERGLRPLLAASGEEAVDMARRHQPAAIVLDLLMPGLDGWETAAALGADPRTRDIPVIVLSVLAESEAPPVGRAREWVGKPAGTGGVVEAVERVVAGSGRVRPVLVVVEDDASLARVLVETFEGAGLSTYQAGTGQEALALCQRVMPDLVILDVTLAEGDGFTVVEGLRRHDELRLVPLVVYTAHDLSEDDKRRLRLGETEFFTKSRVSLEAFEDRVVGLLERLADDDDGRRADAVGAPHPAR